MGQPIGLGSWRKVPILDQFKGAVRRFMRSWRSRPNVAAKPVLVASVDSLPPDSAVIYYTVCDAGRRKLRIGLVLDIISDGMYVLTRLGPHF